ncbi:hypothetical protein, conserved [Eimeria brunetti]|uniref:Uncharacterized protein n=1 Tax=Eimeria brunetti TaxID=51314 RepID=U6LHH9_9EIME|nr:hypothetical protein, conserved [Eimeria brunetti]
MGHFLLDSPMIGAAEQSLAILPQGIAADGYMEAPMAGPGRGPMQPAMSPRTQTFNRSLLLLSSLVAASAVAFLLVQCAMQLGSNRKLNSGSRRLAEQPLLCKEPKPRKGSKKQKEQGRGPPPPPTVPPRLEEPAAPPAAAAPSSTTGTQQLPPKPQPSTAPPAEKPPQASAPSFEWPHLPPGPAPGPAATRGAGTEQLFELPVPREPAPAPNTFRFWGGSDEGAGELPWHLKYFPSQTLAGLKGSQGASEGEKTKQPQYPTLQLRAAAAKVLAESEDSWIGGADQGAPSVSDARSAPSKGEEIGGKQTGVQTRHPEPPTPRPSAHPAAVGGQRAQAPREEPAKPQVPTVPARPKRQESKKTEASSSAAAASKPAGAPLPHTATSVTAKLGGKPKGKQQQFGFTRGRRVSDPPMYPFLLIQDNTAAYRGWPTDQILEATAKFLENFFEDVTALFQNGDGRASVTKHVELKTETKSNLMGCFRMELTAYNNLDTKG